MVHNDVRVDVGATDDVGWDVLNSHVLGVRRSLARALILRDLAAVVVVLQLLLGVDLAVAAMEDGLP